MIGLTNKCGSTTDYQVFLPENTHKHLNYRNLLYPLGIADCLCQFIMDLDESGLFVESVDPGYSKAYLGKRV